MHFTQCFMHFIFTCSILHHHHEHQNCWMNLIFVNYLFFLFLLQNQVRSLLNMFKLSIYVWMSTLFVCLYVCLSVSPFVSPFNHLSLYVSLPGCRPSLFLHLYLPASSLSRELANMFIWVSAICISVVCWCLTTCLPISCCLLACLLCCIAIVHSLWNCQSLNFYQFSVSVYCLCLHLYMYVCYVNILSVWTLMNIEIALIFL